MIAESNTDEMEAGFQCDNGVTLKEATLWYAAVTTPQTEAFSRSQHVGISVFVFVSILLLNLYAPAQPTILERLLASAIIVLSFVPAWFWVSGRDQNPPLLALVALLYAVYYALPIFLLGQYSRAWYLSDIIPATDIEKALGLSCLGLIAMMAGYSARITRMCSQITPKLALEWHDPRAVRDIGFVLLVGGILLRIIWFRYIAYNDSSGPVGASGVQQLFYFLTESPFVGLTMLWALDLSGGLGPLSHKLLRFAIVPFFLVIGVATGTITQAIRVGLLLLFIAATLRRRMLWAFLALGFASIFVLQPTKTMFRQAMDAQMDSGGNSVIGRAGTFLELTYDTITGQSHLGAGIVTISTDRLNLITTFANVVEDTPVFIPYWHGYTYYPLFTKLIPRLLYPEKRQDDAGQAFPRRYGFLSSGDFTTSYKLPQLVEAYLNFGIPGVLIIMFVIGAIYRITQEMFVHPKMGLGGVVAVGYIVTQWLDIEANFSLTFGGLAYALAYIGLVHILVILVAAPRYRGHSETVGNMSLK